LVLNIVVQIAKIFFLNIPSICKSGKKLKISCTIEKKENDSTASNASLITKIKEWHEQGIKKG